MKKDEARKFELLATKIMERVCAEEWDSVKKACEFAVETSLKTRKDLHTVVTQIRRKQQKI